MESHARDGRAAAILVAALLAASCRASPYRDAALSAANWLRASAVPTGTGKDWPSDPRDPRTLSADLYHGTAGVVLFFLEAHRATGDPKHLEDAVAGADALLASIPDALDPSRAGLYTGVAGVGFALSETFEATGRPEYRDGHRRCLDLLRAGARPVGAGVAWNDSTDVVSGAAGIGFFLLDAARRAGEVEARELAVRAGERLLEVGTPRPGGTDWAMDPSFPRRMPNFSHGTAGVATFLAALYEETGRREFLDAALSGARYLISIARTDGERCLVLHHEPGGEDLYYLGWCHGPAGTARLFHRLWRATGEPHWFEWVRRCARAILRSGIPKARTPGFWNNEGPCCGTAGIGEFFLALARATGERAHLDFARACADEVLARATREGDGIRWRHAEHRSRPEQTAAQTGFMQGASGIATFLLHLDAAERGVAPAIVLPDSPIDGALEARAGQRRAETKR